MKRNLLFILGILCLLARSDVSAGQAKVDPVAQPSLKTPTISNEQARINQLMSQLPRYPIAYMSETGEIIYRDNFTNLYVPFTDPSKPGVDFWEVYECRNPDCPGKPRYQVLYLTYEKRSTDYQLVQKEGYFFIFPAVNPALLEMRKKRLGSWRSNDIMPTHAFGVDPKTGRLQMNPDLIKNQAGKNTQQSAAEQAEEERLFKLVDQYTANLSCPACVKAKLIQPGRKVRSDQQVPVQHQTPEQQEFIIKHYNSMKDKR